MENDIEDLVGQMNSILSFVEDTEVLKEKLKHFSDSIQFILQLIKECSESIHSYLSTRAVGKRSLSLILIFQTNLASSSDLESICKFKAVW